MHVVVLELPGLPDVLQIKDIPCPEPQAGWKNSGAASKLVVKVNHG